MVYGGISYYYNAYPFPMEHIQTDLPSDLSTPDWLWGFDVQRAVDYRSGKKGRLLALRVPLSLLLLLFLVTPALWLIARPPNTAAFPVIADTRRAK